MTVADVGLGVLFAYIGQGSAAIFGPRWEIVIGVVLILLGLRWLNLLRFRTVGRERELKKAHGFAGAFLLGIPFSMSFCPFCTPILLSILSVAAATGKVWYSAALMVFFSLGRGLPLLVAGLSTEALKRAYSFQRYIPAFEKAGGAILIILGTYYLYRFSQYLTVL
jgi:cytochrome c-type biogenesis protein